MHPPERGFGKPPRNRHDSAPDGQRPLLQGHLKPASRGRDAAPTEAPAPTRKAAKPKAATPKSANRKAAKPKAR
jgi:hypothetical protein